MEVGKLGEIIMVRRSADPDGTCLKLSRGQWQEFVAGLKGGQFDSSTASDLPGQGPFLLVDQ